MEYKPQRMSSVHHLSHVRHDSGNVKGGGPLPSVIHFTLLLGDNLILPVNAACAPVAETGAG